MLMTVFVARADKLRLGLVMVAAACAMVAVVSGLLLLNGGNSGSGSPSLVVAPVPKVEVDLGKEYPVVIVLTNNSDVAASIVGEAPNCGREVCLLGKTQLPMVIGPHQSGSIEVAVRGTQAGTYQREYSCFTDRPGQFRLTVTIQCTVRGIKPAVASD